MKLRRRANEATHIQIHYGGVVKMKKYVCKEVKAVFKPKRLDDLRPELLTCIGREFNFQYSWLMDENDTFPGVWALTATLPDFIKCWVPEFDLELVKS